MFTVIPDLIQVRSIQRQMFPDIAACGGKSAWLNQPMMGGFTFESPRFSTNTFQVESQVIPRMEVKTASSRRARNGNL
jgi:hypothetical protein